MTLHPIKYKTSLLQDSVSEGKHFSLCSLQVSESSLCLNALLRLKKHTRFLILRENCSILLEKVFFPFTLGERKQTISFLHSHIFIMVHLFLKRLSFFYLFHMPVANTIVVFFLFQESAAVYSLSQLDQVAIFLFKWKIRIESQM